MNRRLESFFSSAQLRGLSVCVAALSLVFGMFAESASAQNKRMLVPVTKQTPQLFVTLSDDFPTPDGMAVDPADGNLVVACPNYSDQSKPACVIIIDKSGNVTKWFDVPVIAETKVSCPMGICFGEKNEIFICDNQGWKGSEEGKFKGRILKIVPKKEIDTSNGTAAIDVTVLVDGMEHPNGVRYHKGQLYVTQSMMSGEKDSSGLLVSGVYRFDPNAENTLTISNTKKDESCILTVLTYNKDCQYGLDGLDFDKAGNLYLGNFGDGTILKASFNNDGKVENCDVWAKNPEQMRTTDGIGFDPQSGILYVADFSENAIAAVFPDAKVVRIAKSPDSDGAKGELDQPGEPIAWNGKLIVSCFDAVTGPDKVNTKFERPSTITSLQLLNTLPKVNADGKLLKTRRVINDAKLIKQVRKGLR